jgi:3-deoxy-D-manno-octulosonate 8-phosphate phosphatase (KDO 8-P phosphatase)
LLSDDDLLADVRVVAFDVDGTLTDGRVQMQADGQDTVSFHVRDGLAIRLLIGAGVPVAFVSGRQSEAARARAKVLGVPHVHVGVKDKPAVLRKIAGEEGVELRQIMFVGDDLPDLPALAVVGLPAAVADAAPEVLERAALVLGTDGGDGVAREVAERLLRVRGQWESAISRFTGPSS